MKLKSIPEDFVVEELPTVQGSKSGRFTFYRLTKRGIGTLEAIEVVRRRWNLAASQVRFGGLKDRHAVTIQYLTILNGPARVLEESSILLEPLGRLQGPYGPGQFRGNRFSITMRDLAPDAVAGARTAASRIPIDGLPNYFDDQRFGSLGVGGEFIGHAWLRGDHERALYLAIAEPTVHDRSANKEIKKTLRHRWGDWPSAKSELPRSHERSLVTYLVDHPTDFRGAFARLNRDLRSLYFSAFQSHLWNLILAAFIEDHTTKDQRTSIAFKSAELPIHHDLNRDQLDLFQGLAIPLPSSRNALPEGPLGPSAERVLRGFGLSWESMRVRHLKDVFLSRGQRPALFRPEHLKTSEGPDDLNPGRQRLSLEFELPRGSYATLLVKRLTDAA